MENFISRETLHLAWDTLGENDSYLWQGLEKSRFDLP